MREPTAELVLFARDLTRIIRLWLCIVSALVVVACGAAGEPERSSAPAAAAETPVSEAGAEAPRIVCLGDSLTAGLGLSPEEAYPALLQRRVRDAGYPHEVMNAGVSGDTSAGGLRRLDWSIDGETRVLVVALGANDGLRGLPIAALSRNLTEIVERAQARGIRVLLAGMEAPPNFGPGYVQEFRQAYADVATRTKAPLVPFLLDGVAGISALNQADGIHPTAEGQRRIADLLWPRLEPLLRTTSTDD